jgi:VIT1/CCC1 family predicted Fe2+/Mn2+ transporter/rubrerythrin
MLLEMALAQGEKAAAERLLEAWSGEVQANAVYSILAARERDPKRAEILKRMAAAEVTHRERIEARLRDMGVTIPDPAGVRLSPWVRLQARLAPLDRMLAYMERNEEVEVSDRYKRPTGDRPTDELLRSIRHEEAAHSRQIGAMRSGDDAQAPATGAQGALDRILGRERWHRSGSGWVSGAIYGANDGLAAVFGIVAGVSGATGGSSFVLTAGLFGAIASGLSMATGAFLAERSEAEVRAANVERERQEVLEHPDEEKEELSLFYQLKGLTKDEADMIASRLAQNPDAMLRALVAEELGGAEATQGRPAQAALAAGISTFIGAMVPVLPFFWMRGTPAVVAAAVVSLVAHFLVGAAKSLFTLRTWWSAGLEMTVAGVIVGAVTYAAGLLFH